MCLERGGRGEREKRGWEFWILFGIWFAGRDIIAGMGQGGESNFSTGGWTMRGNRAGWGIAAAAGLVYMFSGSEARAQFSYGYDSLTYIPTAQTYYANAGYSPIYTDPSTGAFVNGTTMGPRVVAPYGEPPFGTFGRGNGLYTYGRNGAIVAAPARVVAAPRRRGLLGRQRAGR